MTAKRILITGATDGIGLETAKHLAARGQHLLLHGRNPEKLEAAVAALKAEFGGVEVKGYIADFSRLSEVESLGTAVAKEHQELDVLINNAGVLMSSSRLTESGLDVRFVVNTLAPYLLTKRLLPLISASGRVINLSSAAQATVALDALAGKRQLSDGEAYGQSKLAITMWSRQLAENLGARGPAIIAVNPGSFLASKMVKEAYGREGKDLGIGADILTRAALDADFADATGQYFDNDARRFAAPHPDALDTAKCQQLVNAIETLLPS